MAFEVIDTTEIDAGSPITEELWTKVKNSLDSLKASIDASTGVVPIYILNKFHKMPEVQLPVGTIVWGSISTTLNQSGPISEFGGDDNGEWLLCNGQSASGSDWATAQSRTNVPDVRGRYLRMINHSSGNNPDGEATIDSSSADKASMLSHTHSLAHDHPDSFASTSHRHDMAHVHQSAHNASNNMYTLSSPDNSETSIGVSDQKIIDSNLFQAATGTGRYIGWPATSGNSYTTGVLDGPSGTGSSANTGTPNDTTGIANFTGNTGTPSTTGNETAPKTIHENAFIKVNKDYVKTDDEWELYYISKNMQVTDVILTPIDKTEAGNTTYNGTGGTTTLDVQYSSGGDPTLDGTWTSLLSGGLASVAGGADQSASSPTVDATNLVVGQWLRVKIPSVASKLEGIHVFIAGEPTS